MRRVTYSVVARDPETGAFGVAVQSHFFSVGAVGAVGRGRRGRGRDAGVRGAELRTARARTHARRRVGGRRRSPRSSPPTRARRRARSRWSTTPGRAAAHTGDSCVAYAGHRTSATGWSVQANMMRNATVPDAMAEAFVGDAGRPRRPPARRARRGRSRGRRRPRAAVGRARSCRRPRPTAACRPARCSGSTSRTTNARSSSCAVSSRCTAATSCSTPRFERAAGRRPRRRGARRSNTRSSSRPTSSEIRFWLGGVAHAVRRSPRPADARRAVRREPRLARADPAARRRSGVIPDLPGVVELLTDRRSLAPPPRVASTARCVVDRAEAGVHRVDRQMARAGRAPTADVVDQLRRLRRRRSS